MEDLIGTLVVLAFFLLSWVMKRLQLAVQRRLRAMLQGQSQPQRAPQKKQIRRHRPKRDERQPDLTALYDMLERLGVEVPEDAQLSLKFPPGTPRPHQRLPEETTLRGQRDEEEFDGGYEPHDETYSSHRDESQLVYPWQQRAMPVPHPPRVAAPAEMSPTADLVRDAILLQAFFGKRRAVGRH